MDSRFRGNDGLSKLPRIKSGVAKKSVSFLQVRGFLLTPPRNRKAISTLPQGEGDLIISGCLELRHESARCVAENLQAFLRVVHKVLIHSFEHAEAEGLFAQQAAFRR